MGWGGTQLASPSVFGGGSPRKHTSFGTSVPGHPSPRGWPSGTASLAECRAGEVGPATQEPADSTSKGNPVSPSQAESRYGEDCLLWASVSPSVLRGLSVPTLQPKLVLPALISPEDQGCIFLGQRYTRGCWKKMGGRARFLLGSGALTRDHICTPCVCPGSVTTCSLTLSEPPFPCLFYGYHMP